MAKNLRISSAASLFAIYHFPFTIRRYTNAITAIAATSSIATRASALLEKSQSNMIFSRPFNR
jgi:hypothetical protein